MRRCDKDETINIVNIFFWDVDFQEILRKLKKTEYSCMQKICKNFLGEVPVLSYRGHINFPKRHFTVVFVCLLSFDPIVIYTNRQIKENK